MKRHAPQLKTRLRGFLDYLSQNFLFTFLIVTFLLCMASIAVTLSMAMRAEKIHAALVLDQMYVVRRGFLRDTVENMLQTIAGVRSRNLAQARQDVDTTLSLLEQQFNPTNPEAEMRVKKALDSARKRSAISYSLADRASDTVIASSGGGPSYTPYSEYVILGPYRVTCAVDQGLIDATTKRECADIIRAQKFSDGSFFWVNEVLDWNGGDNFAIRRVHAKYPSTEGDYLSTNTKDKLGNRPLLVELNGIKEQGQIFFRYYLERVGTDRVTEKLAFASLYPDYHWIVGMAVEIEDIDAYANRVNISSAAIDKRITLLSVMLLVAAFSLVVVFFALTWRHFVNTTKDRIRNEANTDPLTGALNRRIGVEFLRTTFRKYRHGEIRTPILFAVDIDDFKRVNDTYGHDAGDIVLRAVVDRIRKTMRETDYLFRWGGEEFLIAYSGVDGKDALLVAERLNRQVADTTILLGAASKAENGTESGAKSVCVSVSIGVSWFCATDATFENAILRADRALYRAKGEGKNRASVEEPIKKA